MAQHLQPEYTLNTYTNNSHIVQSSLLPCRTSGLDEEAFGHVHNAIRRGDLVGVKGYPGKSKRGELSVFPTSFIVLAPCLHMLPKYRLDNQASASAQLPWLLSKLHSVTRVVATAKWCCLGLPCILSFGH